MKRYVWAIFALSVLAWGCKGSEEAKPEEGTGATPPAASGGTGGDAGATAAGGYAGVQAILTARCMPCHGENGKEGIDLRSYDSVMKGGEHGAIVKAGDAAGSQIIHALRGHNGIKQMPMNQAPLSEEDIKKIEDWINAGAKNE
ncbi:MAG TPA: c-type cytochrome [Fimbriimonadaceae bacterium]|nr:c-type cytochrome [Fimbriimonadaceae bacterium]